MRVAIAGFGLEGKVSAAYWKARGEDVTVLDEHDVTDAPDGVTVRTGSDIFQDLSGYDMVVRTPSLPPLRLVSAKRLWSATNEFFAHCPAPIVGVTGTKGKGTVSSFITSMLREAGYTVHLLGNIGQPALEVLPHIHPRDIVVYELSSFQLWDLERSPHVAVVLMIEPDHLDVHEDFDEYIAAKSNIRRHQTVGDICIVHPTNQFSRRIAASSTVSQPVLYAVNENGGVYNEKDGFFRGNTRICGTKEVVLPGAFNLENACAAMTATLEFTENTEAIARGLHAFGGLPHRLKFVRELHGVAYYDDSIATTPGSAMAAMRSFPQPKIIILGGSDKGADYEEVVLLAKETGTRVVALGETGDRVAALCAEIGVDVRRPATQTMQSVVELAHAWATSGDVVILSPASASFGLFKNYSDRGDQFVSAVLALPESETHATA